MAARWMLVYLDSIWTLSPPVIFGTYAPGCVLRTVFLEHALENGHIAGRYVDDLKANVECIWVNMISMGPFTTGDKNHGSLVGNIGSEFDVQAKILSRPNLLWTVESKSACADI